MKYMILTYASQQDYDGMAGKAGGEAAWSAADFAAMGAFMKSFITDLEESGELVETRGLVDPVHTRRVQLQDGVPVVTDGPYAETAAVLAGAASRPASAVKTPSPPPCPAAQSGRTSFRRPSPRSTTKKATGEPIARVNRLAPLRVA